MAWAEKRGLMVLHVSFSLLVLRQAASSTTPPVQECETKTICEDQSTKINCENGLIYICTAVYGRSDSETCPHDQVSDTTCGVNVVAVLGRDCNGQSQCTVTASNDLDGDPCGGTYKYLEVAYTCKDFDECTGGTSSCDANARCQNAFGFSFCACNSGYSGNGLNCNDVDECASRPAICNTNAACTNTPGSFKCACNPGYRGSGSTCTDVNECKVGTNNYCYANSACTNTPGSFTCICNEGYTFNGTGCIDADECVTGTHSCDANATCQNAPGSFFCACNIGYTGNGFSCIDIDECISRPDPCNTNAACTNTPGSFKCACNPGYRDDGSTCTDVNECKDDIDNCNANSTCTNTPGSFTCTCNEGYTFNGTDCIVDPITTVTTIGPSPPASDTSSTDSISPVIPAVIVVVVVFLIVAISGVICYKRRQLSRSKDRDPHLDAPATVLNPSFTTSAVDQNDYTECVNPIEGASNAAMPSSSEDNQHNEYFELPTSVPPTRQGNMDIYNEVGEQDYNVLFGGKEQGDYHEYNLPETAEKTQSGPYQDLMKDKIKGAVTSPSDTLLKGVEHASNDDNDKIFQPQNKGAPTERDSHAYQDLREDDSNYIYVLRDDGAPTSPGAKHFVPAMNHISKTQTLQDQDEEYTELPSLVSPTNHDNRDIYNEVGEQDYNVLFGGKEQGDYHEYNLPECAQKTPSGPYQELLKGGKQDLHGQTKRGVPIETVDQGYQDLRKDDYTSPHLNAKTPTKPESSSSVASMNNTYQALQTSGPDYAILEPNTNDPSPACPKPGSLPNHDYQSLAKNDTGSDDTARGFDQGGVSMKQDASQDNTYQHLITDDNTPESMNGNTKAAVKDQDITYDVLQHGPKTSGHPPSNGYSSLGLTTETGDLDDDCPGAGPAKATSDYEVPKQEISEEPYDHLQRKELSETSPINPGTTTDKSADDDDYENPISSLVDKTNTYQTLDNRQYQGNKQDGADEDYSHLQRPLGNTVSSDETGASNLGNQYGKINFAYESK